MHPNGPQRPPAQTKCACGCGRVAVTDGYIAVRPANSRPDAPYVSTMRPLCEECNRWAQPTSATRIEEVAS